MAHTIATAIRSALTGADRYRATHRVSGVNVRGEAFDLERSEYDARDFAAEIRELGGTAKVTRLGAQR
jgi:hypothetical protein